MLRLRWCVLCVAACMASGTLAVAAAAAPGNSLVAELLGVPGAGTARVGAAGEKPIGTVESAVAPLPGGAEIVSSASAVVEPVGPPVETIVESVAATAGAAGQTAGGAVEAAVSSTAETVESVVATGAQTASQLGASVTDALGSGPALEPLAGGGEPGAPSEAPPIDPPPGVSPTPASPSDEQPPVGSEPGSPPTVGNGAPGGSSPESSGAGAPQPAVTGFPSGGSIPGGGSVVPSAATIGDLLLVQALCALVLGGGPTAGPTSLILLLEQGTIDSVTSPATFASDLRGAAEFIGLDAIAAPSGEAGWVAPLFSLVDPRASLGAVVFVVLGLGALALAMAGIPRRAYAGAGLTLENVFALRLTLGCAGFVLVATATIGQLAA